MFYVLTDTIIALHFLLLLNIKSNYKYALDMKQILLSGSPHGSKVDSCHGFCVIFFYDLLLTCENPICCILMINFHDSTFDLTNYSCVTWWCSINIVILRNEYINWKSKSSFFGHFKSSHFISHSISFDLSVSDFHWESKTQGPKNERFVQFKSVLYT